MATRGQHWVWGFLPDAEPGRKVRQGRRADTANKYVVEKVLYPHSGEDQWPKGDVTRQVQTSLNYNTV